MPDNDLLVADPAPLLGAWQEQMPRRSLLERMRGDRAGLAPRRLADVFEPHPGDEAPAHLSVQTDKHGDVSVCLMTPAYIDADEPLTAARERTFSPEQTAQASAYAVDLERAARELNRVRNEARRACRALGRDGPLDLLLALRESVFCAALPGRPGIDYPRFYVTCGLNQALGLVCVSVHSASSDGGQNHASPTGRRWDSFAMSTVTVAALLDELSACERHAHARTLAACREWAAASIQARKRAEDEDERRADGEQTARAVRAALARR